MIVRSIVTENSRLMQDSFFWDMKPRRRAAPLLHDGAGPNAAACCYGVLLASGSSSSGRKGQPGRGTARPGARQVMTASLTGLRVTQTTAPVMRAGAPVVGRSRT